MVPYIIQQTLGLTILEYQEILNIDKEKGYFYVHPLFDFEKLNLLGYVSILWGDKDLGRIGRYLHDPVGEHKESLFDLLKKKEWDMDLIQLILDEIAVIKTAKKDSLGTPDYSRLGSIDFL